MALSSELQKTLTIRKSSFEVAERAGVEVVTGSLSSKKDEDVRVGRRSASERNEPWVETRDGK